MLGDIVGTVGLHAVLATLPSLKLEHEPDFVIANGENVAAGRGITGEAARRLLKAGVDVITMGNHVWHKADGVAFLDKEPRLLRPANYPPGAPGHGSGVYLASNGAKVFVANVLGRALMESIDDPFRAVDVLIGEARASGASIVCIDFHAETTSEKQAIALYLDGRATFVAGTHTHVQTADERVLPHGTAFITDIGMCGPQNSVIGMNPETVLARFTTQRPQKFEVADGPCHVHGVLVTVVRQTGQATGIKRIMLRDIEGDGG